MSDEQLWSNEQVHDKAYDVAKKFGLQNGLCLSIEIALLSMRDDWTAERAKLMQQVKELELAWVEAAREAAEARETLAEREAYEVVDTIETEWGYQLACVTEHPDGEITLQTTGYSIADPDQQFSIRMPKQYRICRKQSEASE
jgi:hypothetical protein